MPQDFEWKELAERMSQISEEAFFAGWMDDLEFHLWDAIHGGSRKYGQVTLTQTQLDGLRQLSGRLGGWVCFGDDEGVEDFVPLDRWVVLYDQWKRKRDGGENA